MRLALKSAGLEPRDVQYINAHGTSTPFNDLHESKAIKRVFGEHAKKLMVSSTKSMTGHMLGAAGGAEAIFTALTVSRGVVPPTINYTTPDPIPTAISTTCPTGRARLGSRWPRRTPSASVGRTRCW